MRQDQSTDAVKQIALDIVVNTGYVSNLTNQNDYYYNSSVAHAFYNASCSIPREGSYLHGEVVSLGVLVLFAYTGDTENLERYAAFNNQMGLPVTLEQVGLSEADIPALCEYAHATNEWKQGNPEPFTDENSPPPSRPPTLTATRSRTDPKPPQMGRAPFWWFFIDPAFSSYSNPILYEKGFGYVFCLSEILRKDYSERQTGTNRGRVSSW